MMEKVVQEARRLKQDAEENSKVSSVSSASKPFHFISVNMHVMHYKRVYFKFGK
jgi:hypothetical protein